jgi:hypothetical protein
MVVLLQRIFVLQLLIDIVRHALDATAKTFRALLLAFDRVTFDLVPFAFKA